LKDEGFSCSLDISKFKFLIKKRFKKSFKLYFFQFLTIKTLKPDSLEMLDPDPDSMNPVHSSLFAK
jgi:hypothetical protein